MVSVERSLTKVDGVTKVTVSLDEAEAIVDFDDAKTTVEALIEATADAGYPSKLRTSGEKVSVALVIVTPVQQSETTM